MAGIRHLSNKKSAKQSTAAKSSARAFTKRVNRLKQAAAKPASSALKRKRSKREGGSEGGQSQGSTQQSDCSSSSNEVAFGTPDLPPDVLFFQLETLYERRVDMTCMINPRARTDGHAICPLPIYPTMDDVEHSRKVLQTPDGLLMVSTRRDLLALPVEQVGQILADYRLDTSGPQASWIDVLLEHLRCPQRARAESAS